MNGASTPPDSLCRSDKMSLTHALITPSQPDDHKSILMADSVLTGRNNGGRKTKSHCERGGENERLIHGEVASGKDGFS